MTRRITIDPVTRLEGHGKIEIFLDAQGAVERARTEGRQEQIGEREPGRERSQQQGHRIAVEPSGGPREQRPEPGRELGEAGIVEKAPGQDPRRIVQQEVPRDQHEQGGNEDRVRRGTAGRGRVRRRGAQPTSRSRARP